MVRKIVIDGGPCTGKTTILKGLENVGYQIVEEAARFIIQERQKKNPTYGPNDNLLEFQECVVNMQWNWEAIGESYAKVKNVNVACDRGMVSTIAYLRNGGIDVPEGFLDAVKDEYHQVFIPDQLPKYINDSERLEEQDEGLRIHNHVIQAYKDTGYDPIIVPVFDTPEERVQFVLERIVK